MAKWAKCWDAIYSGLRFNQRSYIDAYIVPYGSLTALKTFLPRFGFFAKKKRKKEREKEKIVIPKSESNKSPRRIPD